MFDKSTGERDRGGGAAGNRPGPLISVTTVLCVFGVVWQKGKAGEGERGMCLLPVRYCGYVVLSTP